MTNIEELTNQLSAMATDQQEGVLRSYSDSPPSHYCLRVEAFSLLTEQSVDGYETEVFGAGGYNCHYNMYNFAHRKLVFYPKWKQEKRWFFLLDQKKCKYLVVEGIIHDLFKPMLFAKEICFHRVMLRSPRFDKLMPLKEFTDASNGFLIEDTCVIGAEVFVCKEKALGKREHLSKINNAFMSKHVWNVDKFSKLTGKCHGSKPISAGDQKWQISIYPKGISYGKGTHCSIYLKLVDRKPIPPQNAVSVSSHPHGVGEFISLKILEEEKGLLKNDTCILEAEVIVHGVSKVL
ncbi:uncharacterized protein LOC126792317 [Argentina anserina]|uniref:uncharacterized protein LOC126792317 n=1 Tax=Argentina anserina TaxID=57926 RepID=UPI0021764F71|nr:uncharacterized protein LOC126792317 [Potentilla anserina]